MTQTLERPATLEATPSVLVGTSRGGSYVTLPGHPRNSPRTEAGYVTLPGGWTHAGNKAQGTYVTLHTAPLGETDVSYTRRG